MVDQHWKALLCEVELLWASHLEVQLGDVGKRNFPSLDAGQAARIQDQATMKWDRSSVVVGDIPHHQYLVWVDGSSRMSQKRRKHLCAVMEVLTVQPPMDVSPPTKEAPQQHPKRSHWQPRQLDGYF